MSNIYLSQKICISCVKKVEDIHSYYSTVLHNQSLHLTYYELTNDDNIENDIKPDKSELTLVLENDNLSTTSDIQMEKDIKPDKSELTLVLENDNLSTTNDIQMEKDIKPDKSELTLVLENDNLSTTSDVQMEKDIKLDKSELTLVLENNNLSTTSDIPMENDDKPDKSELTLALENENLSTTSDIEEDISDIYFPDSHLDNDETNIKLSDDDEPLSEKKLGKNLLDRKDEEKKRLFIKKAYLKQAASNEEPFYYKCLMCLKFIGSKDDLIAHYHIVHRPPVTIAEPYTITDKYTVVKSEVGSVKWVCKICKKYETNDIRNMKKHLLRHNKNRPKPFVCKLCGRAYKNPYEIIIHGRAHNGPKLSCEYKGCSYSTAHDYLLKVHQLRHNNQYKYKCSECSKGFRCRPAFEDHRNLHTGQKPFVCDLCGHAFTGQCYLTNHKARVHPEVLNRGRYVCLVCQLRCISKDILDQHMVQKHGMQKKCLCDVCGIPVINAHKLKAHKIVHLDTKSYVCHQCPMAFTQQGRLNAHLRTHTDVRKFSCDLCDKSYKKISSLKRHLDTHKQECRDPEKCQSPNSIENNTTNSE